MLPQLRAAASPALHGNVRGHVSALLRGRFPISDHVSYRFLSSNTTLSKQQFKWNASSISGKAAVTTSTAARFSTSSTDGKVSANVSDSIAKLSQEMINAIKSNKTVYPVSSDQPQVFLAQKKLFGYYKGNNAKSGRKILNRTLVGEKIVNYYSNANAIIRKVQAGRMKKDMKKLQAEGKTSEAEILKAKILITRRTPAQRYQAMRMNKLRRRGKGPPKKGFGKRSGKKKKK